MCCETRKNRTGLHSVEARCVASSSPFFFFIASVFCSSRFFFFFFSCSSVFVCMVRRELNVSLSFFFFFFVLLRVSRSLAKSASAVLDLWWPFYTR